MAEAGGEKARRASIRQTSVCFILVPFPFAFVSFCLLIAAPPIFPIHLRSARIPAIGGPAFGSAVSAHGGRACVCARERTDGAAKVHGNARRPSRDPEYKRPTASAASVLVALRRPKCVSAGFPFALRALTSRSLCVSDKSLCLCFRSSQFSPLAKATNNNQRRQNGVRNAMRWESREQRARQSERDAQTGRRARARQPKRSTTIGYVNDLHTITTCYTFTPIQQMDRRDCDSGSAFRSAFCLRS